MCIYIYTLTKRLYFLTFKLFIFKSFLSYFSGLLKKKFHSTFFFFFPFSLTSVSQSLFPLDFPEYISLSFSQTFIQIFLPVGLLSLLLTYPYSSLSLPATCDDRGLTPADTDANTAWPEYLCVLLESFRFPFLTYIDMSAQTGPWHFSSAISHTLFLATEAMGKEILFPFS